MIEEDNFPAFLEELQTEWRGEMNSSPDVKRAKLDIEYHRKKVRQLTEELNNAENWEKELLEKEKQVGERFKPALMRFYEGLDPPVNINRTLLHEVATDHAWEKVVSLTRRRVGMLESSERRDIIFLMWTIIQLRDEYVEAGNNEPQEHLQDQAKRLLRQLGGSKVSWENLEDREAGIMLDVTQQVENIPPFVKRMVETFLSNAKRTRIIYRETGVQTGEPSSS